MHILPRLATLTAAAAVVALPVAALPAEAGTPTEPWFRGIHHACPANEEGV